MGGGGPVPQWYAAVAEGRIVAGLGVIENDFHCRRDLTPNVCAVYVEEDCRRRGLAGEMTRMYIHREGAHHEDRDLHLGL